MEQPKNNIKLVSKKNSRVILPNILTLIGVCIGLTSIKFSFDGNFQLAIIAVIVAAVIDGLDGRIARLIKGTSEFGKELDSLTDFVSFGIAPVFVIYFWELNQFGRIGWLLVLLFSVCCVLRLARFNLTKFDNNEEWKMNFFQGIPSPAGGCLILFPIMYELSSFSTLFQINNVSPFLVVLACFALSACATKKVSTSQIQGDVYTGTDTVEYLASGVADRVFFATNESGLTTASRETLRKQAAWLS